MSFISWFRSLNCAGRGGSDHDNTAYSRRLPPPTSHQQSGWIKDISKPTPEASLYLNSVSSRASIPKTSEIISIHTRKATEPTSVLTTFNSKHNPPDDTPPQENRAPMPDSSQKYIPKHRLLLLPPLPNKPLSTIIEDLPPPPEWLLNLPEEQQG